MANDKAVHTVLLARGLPSEIALQVSNKLAAKGIRSMADLQDDFLSLGGLGVREAGLSRRQAALVEEIAGVAGRDGVAGGGGGSGGGDGSSSGGGGGGWTGGGVGGHSSSSSGSSPRAGAPHAAALPPAPPTASSELSEWEGLVLLGDEPSLLAMDFFGQDTLQQDELGGRAGGGGNAARVGEKRGRDAVGEGVDGDPIARRRALNRARAYESRQRKKVRAGARCLCVILWRLPLCLFVAVTCHIIVPPRRRREECSSSRRR